jgi:hypothetical protein
MLHADSHELSLALGLDNPTIMKRSVARKLGLNVRLAWSAGSDECHFDFLKTTNGIVNTYERVQACMAAWSQRVAETPAAQRHPLTAKIGAAKQADVRVAISKKDTGARTVHSCERNAVRSARLNSRVPR